MTTQLNSKTTFTKIFFLVAAFAVAHSAQSTNICRVGPNPGKYKIDDYVFCTFADVQCPQTLGKRGKLLPGVVVVSIHNKSGLVGQELYHIRIEGRDCKICTDGKEPEQKWCRDCNQKANPTECKDKDHKLVCARCKGTKKAHANVKRDKLVFVDENVDASAAHNRTR